MTDSRKTTRPARQRFWFGLLSVFFLTNTVCRADKPCRLENSHSQGQLSKPDPFRELQGTWRVVHVEVDGKPMPGWIDPSPIRIVGEEVGWWGPGPGGVGEQSQQLQLDGNHFVLDGGGPDWPGLLFKGEYQLKQGALVLSTEVERRTARRPLSTSHSIEHSGPPRHFAVMDASVLHVAFSPDGRTLASIGKDDCLRFGIRNTGV